MCQLCIISVDWWRTLHQKASLSVGRRPEITGEMYWTLLYSALTVTIVGAWLIIHRYRVIRLEEIRDEENLKMLISSRHQEKPTDSTAAGEVS